MISTMIRIHFIQFSALFHVSKGVLRYEYDVGCLAKHKLFCLSASMSAFYVDKQGLNHYSFDKSMLPYHSFLLRHSHGINLETNNQKLFINNDDNQPPKWRRYLKKQN